MDCSRALVGAGLAAYLVGQINQETAFVPVLTGRTDSTTRLAHGATRATGHSAPQGTSALVGAAVAMGAAVGAMHGSAARRVQRVAMKADDSGLRATGPITVYTKALMDVAASKKESVTVTKDVMKVKKVFSDQDFLDKLQFVQNELGTSEMQKATGMIKLLQPMESAVFPKFVTFLAKKRRLSALKTICSEYVSSLYSEQSIAPVMVRSAQRLTNKQIDNIKSKMKAKTGAKDVKLVAEVDAGLLGGFVIEWGYTDPENLNCPTEGMDLSLKAALLKAALDKGVVTQM
mmetsp:Transcript_73887/g.171390  ORF Transcript_73887/g.171390 Transcript_73887/m.171390 type:complete len:289 (+) Transcript_73887:67-933(+)